MAPESTSPTTTETPGRLLQAPKPQAGQTVTVQSAAGAEIALGFEPGEATMSREGENLSFRFNDGGSVVLTNFFAVGDQPLPNFKLPDGVQVASHDFFASLDVGFSTAAGPAPAPSAPPSSGEGAYTDDPGLLLNGVDRLGSLGTVYWGRDSEVPERQWGLLERPGGDFSVDVVTNTDMFAASGVFEDGRANQHLYGNRDVPGNEVTPGQIHFTFSPSGTTVVDGIHLSGFDAGTKIYLGEYGEPGTVEILISGPGQVVDFQQSDFTDRGVYILAPANSEHDMAINAVVDLRALSSGITDTATGTFVIVVDAVADLPENAFSGIGAVTLDGSMTVTDHETAGQRFIDGWAEDVIAKTQDPTDASAVRVASVPVTATITFFDYGESGEGGHEHHYALIEKPAAGWTCATALDTITLRCDASGVPLVDQNATGAMEKEFFRIPVDNADILAAGGTVSVQADLSGPADYTADTTIKLWAGGMAEEHPSDLELTYANNKAYNFSEAQVDLAVDTVDSALTVRVGWVAEGNSPNKNLLPGDTQGHDWTPEAGGHDAGATGDGAPIHVAISGGILPDGGPAGEQIIGATFSFNEGDAVLRVGSVELTASQDIAGVHYEVETNAGVTTVTISNLPSGAVDLDALGLNFVPKNFYEDADISFSYTVDVESSAGAKAHFSGESLVTVDAVADLSTDVKAGIGTDTANPTFIDNDTANAVHDDMDRNFHYGAQDGPKAGWEIDEFRLDYSSIKYGFSVTVDTSFPDEDGSERHFILVEKPADTAWELGLLPAGHHVDAADPTYTDAGGTVYWKIEIDDSTIHGNSPVTIPLNYNGSIAGDLTLDLKTGSYAQETLTVDADGHPTGREYDVQNNTAVRTDGTQVEYAIDVFNSTLTVGTGWASEGNNDAKHLNATGPSAAYVDTNAYAGSTANGPDGATNLGAPITFTLSGASGSPEHIDSVTFTFEGARGDLVLADGTHPTGTPVPGQPGLVTVTLAGSQLPGLVFQPAAGGAQSFNYSDVRLDYTVSVSNDAGASAVFTGSSQIVIDAVADKPGVAIPSGGDAVDYPHTFDPETGLDTAQDSARPGDTVTVHGTVGFPDVSGGENHYILIENGNSSGDHYLLEGVKITAGSESLSLSATQLAGFATTALNGVTYYLVPAEGNFTNGDTVASFDVDITIKTVGETSHDNSVGFGGHATIPDSMAGSAGGAPAVNYEFDTANNNAYTTGSVTVRTEVVDTKTMTMHVGDAYENADHRANEGFIARADMLYTAPDGTLQFKPGYLAQVQADSAPVTFTLEPAAANETISCLSVRFQVIDDGITNPASTGNFMYGDTLIPLTYAGIVNGDLLICAYDAVSGYVTLTVIPADGVYETSTELYFVPGESFHGTDIPLDFAAIVHDAGSGFSKEFSNLSGAAGKALADALANTVGIPTDPNHMSQNLGGQDASGPIDNLVDVDSVAQKPAVATPTIAGGPTNGDPDAVDANHDGYYDNVVPGGQATIQAEVTFHDLNDGSERHYVLVQAYPGWQAPTGLAAVDAGGVEHTLGVTWTLQKINGVMYYKAEIANADIRAYGDGTLDLRVAMTTPADAAGTMNFTIGAASWEDDALLDQELTLDNNHAFDTKSASVAFSKAGGLWMEPTGPVYENDTPDANKSDPNNPGLPDNHTVNGTTIIVHADAADSITDFRFTNYDPSRGVVSLNGVPINADGTLPNGVALHGGDTFRFVPARDYSDTDLNLTYSATIVDRHSGDSHPGDGGFTIVVDAVAELPVDVYPTQATVNGETFGGETTIAFAVHAKFEDFDGSEQHFVLVEAKANMTIGKSTGTFSVMDPVTGRYVTYYKIPVDNSAIDPSTGEVVVTISIQAGRLGSDGPGHIRIGALSEDHPTDNGEVTYHNNTAFADGGSVTVNYNIPGGHIIHIGDAYENDTPHANESDPNNPGRPNLTPAGGAAVTFGYITDPSNPITTVDLTWDPAKGYIVDGHGTVYTSGSAAGLDAAGIRFVPNNTYGDADETLHYTVYDGTGASFSGDAVIIVDAVAEKPTDPTTFVDYGPGHTAAPGNGAITLTVGGTFVDNDGSETHYALVEQRPGLVVAGAETVHLDGMSYYRVEIPAGQSSVNVTVQLPGAPDPAGYDLRTGIMAVEDNLTDLESTLDNNISWTLDDTPTHIAVSLVDSSISIVIGNAYEDQTIPVVINASLSADDTFNGLTLHHDGNGVISVSDPLNIGGWSIAPNGDLIITNAAALGNIAVTFTPESHNDADVHWSWSATFTDNASGDVATPGGSGTTIVDAVADAPTASGIEFLSDDGFHRGVSSGGTGMAKVTLNFADHDGSEVHYAILQETNDWKCDGVLVNGLPATLVTVFDENGVPHYAVKIEDAMLDASGNVQVGFHIAAPYTVGDLDATLRIGGISIETTAGAAGSPGGLELTLDNNWAETDHNTVIDLRVGVVTSTTVVVAPDAPSMVEDSGRMHITFTVPDTALTHDTVQSVTILVPANGSLIIDDGHGNVAVHTSGSVVIDEANLNNVYFEPNEHWSGTVVLDITAATLVDIDSGETKAASILTDGSFEVTDSSSGFAAHLESASAAQHRLFGILDTSEDLRFEQHVAGIDGHDGHLNGGHDAAHGTENGDTFADGTVPESFARQADHTDGHTAPVAGLADGHPGTTAGAGLLEGDALRLADLVDDEHDSLGIMLAKGNVADPHQTDNATLHAVADAPEQAHATAASNSGQAEAAPTAIPMDHGDAFHFQSAQLDAFTVDLTAGHDALTAAQMTQDVLRITG